MWRGGFAAAAQCQREDTHALSRGSGSSSVTVVTLALRARNSGCAVCRTEAGTLAAKG